MNTKLKSLKLGIFMFLLFALPIGAFSQTVTAYLCGTGTATLVPDFGTYIPVNGDKIVWSEVGGGAVTYTVGTDPTLTFTTPSNLSNGDHKYTVHVIPLDQTVCPGSPSDEYLIHKLPGTTVALASPIANYCTDAPSRSVITATPATPPPAGVTLTYTWSATSGGSPVTITDLGTSVGNVFTMKSGVTDGTYIFTAVAKYDTGSVPLKPTTSCEYTSTTQSITVTAKPGKPTVTVQ
ncbi:hypothetical protein [Pedobacter sp. B4-66]|uniref:hypothetical protein n=1 Tax=Pedobacter sp. B4-66 TaxID=2817280 RepID=UPI001BDB1F52|nr:hypothetical protein [Pedobacter sp. B4-66]